MAFNAINFIFCASNRHEYIRFIRSPSIPDRASLKQTVMMFALFRLRCLHPICITLIYGHFESTRGEETECNFVDSMWGERTAECGVETVLVEPGGAIYRGDFGWISSGNTRGLVSHRLTDHKLGPIPNQTLLLTCPSSRPTQKGAADLFYWCCFW